MELTYSDMYMLMQKEPEARKYYESLPIRVQEQLSANSAYIRSLSGMKDFHRQHKRK